MITFIVAVTMSLACSAENPFQKFAGEYRVENVQCLENGQRVDRTFETIKVFNKIGFSNKKEWWLAKIFSSTIESRNLESDAYTQQNDVRFIADADTAALLWITKPALAQAMRSSYTQSIALKNLQNGHYLLTEYWDVLQDDFRYTKSCEYQLAADQ